MLPTFRTGAVVYTQNLPGLQAFYRDVVGLEVELVESDYAVLSSAGFQLVILSTASSVTPENPPQWRTEVPTKMCFEVSSISDVRLRATPSGGEVLPPDREWDFQGYRVCDGRDPDGNVIQFRAFQG